MNILKTIAYVLTIIGALNWGLIGIFGFNLVAALFGNMTLLARIVYSLIGISAVITALTVHNCEQIDVYETCESGQCGL